MKKFFKTLAVLSAITLVSSGFIACSNGDDDDATTLALLADSSSSKVLGTGNYIETSGTVSAPVNNVSKCKDSKGGVYEFTQTLSRSVAADGEWSYTEKGKTTPKYSGEYTGDISSFGSDESDLILKVEKVANSSGTMEEAAEKKLFSFNATSDGKFTATIPNIELVSDYDAVFSCTFHDDPAFRAICIGTYYFKDGKFSIKLYCRIEGRNDFLYIQDTVIATGTYTGNFAKNGSVELTCNKVIDQSDERWEKISAEMQMAYNLGKKCFYVTNKNLPLVSYKETWTCKIDNDGNLIDYDDETNEQEIYIRR